MAEETTCVHMSTLEDIIAKAVSYMPELKPERLEQAFSYATRVHRNHYRFSGEPYVEHLLALCQRLLPYKPDEATLIAAFMHDVSQGEDYDLDYIREHFGEDVMKMVECLEKINTVSLRSATTETESLRKVLLSLATDIRVVLIRMADRLHNMETLDFVSEEKRKPIAKETLEIYAPVAARLGIYRMKWRLEDLAFKYLHPEEYTHLKQQLDVYLKKQVSVIDYIQNELKQFLYSRKTQAKVEGRLKNLYSIYNKLKVKNYTSLHEIFDIFAFRIILPTRYNNHGEEMTEHLYALLGNLHSKWSPLSNRFKDYVALPKPNGYKSLHTTVLGLTPEPLHQPTEIQIRSQRMHEESNFGITSHWLYKEEKNGLRSQQLFEQIKKEEVPKDLHLKDPSLKTLIRLHRNLDGEQKIMKPMNVDLFQDRIFVLTPEGDIKDLPNGATPLDFAYAIHTDIGHRCQGAKVNGAIVPLEYQLKSGETVEILLKNKPDPKPHWLSFVKTSQARAKIKNFFKSLDTQRYFKQGKEIINKYLTQANLPLLEENLSVFRDFESKKLSLRERESLVAEVGSGALSATVVLKKIYGQHVNFENGNDTKSSHTDAKPQTAKAKFKLKNGDIIVGGETDVPYKLSQCCNPKLSQDIIAYIGRGNAVRIHLQSCKFLKNIDQSRILEASWNIVGLPVAKKPVKLLLQAKDRVGLIRDIAEVISGFNVNIQDFTVKEKANNIIQREMVLEIENDEQLEKILRHLHKVRNVIKVEAVPSLVRS